MASAPSDSPDLHGNVPDHCGAVLLLVDVINDLDFPQNEHLIARAPELASRIRKLKQRCTSAGIPVIYVNDNKGRWRSDINTVLTQAQREGAPGRDFVRTLAPDANDYVVLKPKHSAFFATPLQVILESIGAHTVIIAGLTSNACVLVSAGEVFVRGYRLVVPEDCVAALTPDAQEHALKIMKDSYRAMTTRSDDLDFEALLKRP